MGEVEPLVARSPKMRARAALYEASLSSRVMSLRALAAALSESLLLPEMSLSVERSRDWRLFEGSRRMILKPALGAAEVGDRMAAWVGEGEERQVVDADADADADGLGELGLAWVEVAVARLMTAE